MTEKDTREPRRATGVTRGEWTSPRHPALLKVAELRSRRGRTRPVMAPDGAAIGVVSIGGRASGLFPNDPHRPEPPVKRPRAAATAVHVFPKQPPTCPPWRG
jgi:hypothetical protein